AVLKHMRQAYGVNMAGGQEHLKPKLVRLGHLGFVRERDVIAGVVALGRALEDGGHAADVQGAVAATLAAYSSP
ncbi:MAG: alanine--glyoxylate aminotransferase family protein, partial [Myxococcota bacterium]